MVGRFKDEWGPEHQAQFAFYESDCLNDALTTLQTELKKVDRRLQQRQREMKRITEDASRFVQRSDAMQRVVTQAKRVASVDSTVLLTGESGSGKERIARLIHESAVERKAILATLTAEGGNRAKTSERLAIGQATLFESSSSTPLKASRSPLWRNFLLRCNNLCYRPTGNHARQAAAKRRICQSSASGLRVGGTVDLSARVRRHERARDR